MARAADLFPTVTVCYEAMASCPLVSRQKLQKFDLLSSSPQTVLILICLPLEEFDSDTGVTLEHKCCLKRPNLTSAAGFWERGYLHSK